MNHAQQFAQLTHLITEIENINAASAVLSWDQHTYMPVQGATGRGRQLATLGKIAHEKLTHPQIGTLLEALQTFEESIPYSSFEASFLRNIRWRYLRLVKVPASFIEELLSHQSLSFAAWVEAKREKKFAIVQPFLEKTLELSRKYVGFFDYQHIADPLIDTSDHGFTAQIIQEVFTDLKKELVPFVKDVAQRSIQNDSCLRQAFPVPLQEQFCQKMIQLIGFDFTRGRLDTTHHPFMTSFAHGDVRITTRYQEKFLAESLFSTIHEMGHAFYEMGNDIALDGSPLFGGTSSGVHESQSRLWENIVGRSVEFWEYFYPLLQKTFAQQLENVSLNEFYAAINQVSKSLIRTDADELHYNLHVMIRFELELDMLEGRVKIKDLPEAWNAAYARDLGVVPPDDALGCMQDIHWYDGLIGGQFQGYTLGNIMSAQFFAAAERSNPNIWGGIKTGNFKPLQSWLQQNLYQYGKKYTSLEVLKQATGDPLHIEPYMQYLRKKFPIK